MVDRSVENESPPSSPPRVPNRQLRTASSSAGTSRAEPGVRVGLAKLHERACAHLLPILSKRLSARDESGSSASFLRMYVFQNSA